MRANFLFRAVPVGAGRTRVHVRRRPAPLRRGLWIAGAGGLGLVATGLVARRGRRG